MEWPFGQVGNKSDEFGCNSSKQVRFVFLIFLIVMKANQIVDYGTGPQYCIETPLDFSLIPIDVYLTSMLVPHSVIRRR